MLPRFNTYSFSVYVGESSNDVLDRRFKRFVGQKSWFGFGIPTSLKQVVEIKQTSKQSQMNETGFTEEMMYLFTMTISLKFVSKTYKFNKYIYIAYK